MTFPAAQEPPTSVELSIEEALELLAVLEDVRDALLTTDHLVEVALAVAQIQRMSRKLGFDELEGGSDAS